MNRNYHEYPLVINTETDTWMCTKHNVGGGPLELAIHITQGHPEEKVVKMLADEIKSLRQLIENLKGKNEPA